MRIGSLFSGAGGLDMAALALWPHASIAWHSETDEHASKVLAHHWPDVPNLGDITQIRWSEVEPVDVLIGGFPCQDISVAGLRAGLAAGTRSGLWSVMAAAINTLRPRHVLIENVEGILHAAAARPMESGPDALGDRRSEPVLRALGAVLGDLASLGLDADWCGLRASNVGCCHHRLRIFVHAYPADTDSNTVRLESVTEPGRGGAPVDRRDRPHPADTTLDGRARVDDRPSGPRARTPGQRDAAGSVGAAPVPVMLPTPSASAVAGGHASRSGARSDELLLPGLAQAHATGALLPTPRSSDDTRGDCPSERDRRSPSLIAVGSLLPTPLARLGDNRGASHPDRRRELSGGRNHGELDDIVSVIGVESGEQSEDAAGQGLRDMRARGSRVSGGGDSRVRWGKFEAAIRRQERVFGRPAPDPTEPNRVGGRRLSPEFASWMMCWPDGWVTDPAIGLPRSAQLRCIGNGVVTPQATAAYRYLLSIAGQPIGGAA